MKTLILLHGKKRSGKDQFTKYLKKYDKSVRSVALAAPIKQILATTFNIPLGHLEDYKEGNFALLHGLPTDGDIDGGDYQMQTYREIIQRFGTEAMQETFGVDVWIRQATKAIDKWFKHTDIVVVTDVRFDAELRMLSNYYHNGWDTEAPHGTASDTVRVIKVYIKRDTEQEDGHISEQGLDLRLFDMFIDNNGSLEDLEDQATLLLKGLNV